VLDPKTFAPQPEEGPNAPELSRRERINALYGDHWREAEFAKKLRKGFDFAELNRPLTMSTTRGLRDEGDGLLPGERAFVIPDAVTGLLQDNGLDLPAGQPDRPHIANAAPLLICRGRPKTCKGVSVRSRLSNPNFGAPSRLAISHLSEPRQPAERADPSHSREAWLSR